MIESWLGEGEAASLFERLANSARCGNMGRVCVHQIHSHEPVRVDGAIADARYCGGAILISFGILAGHESICAAAEQIQKAAIMATPDYEKALTKSSPEL